MHDVEPILVQVKRLFEVFLLHLVPDRTLLAVVGWVSARVPIARRMEQKRSLTSLGEEQLVDHDVVGVDTVRRQFLDQPLGLV